MYNEETKGIWLKWKKKKQQGRKSADDDITMTNKYAWKLIANTNSAMVASFLVAPIANVISYQMADSATDNECFYIER